VASSATTGCSGQYLTLGSDRVRNTSPLLRSMLTISLAKTSVPGGDVVALAGGIVEGVVVGVDRSTEPGVR
jgi:hypothetical protein